MDFKNLNLRKSHPIDIINIFRENPNILNNDSYKDLKVTIKTSVTDGLYKVAINSLVLGLCYSPNKTFEFVKQIGILRYSNYINKKCIVKNLALDILKISALLSLEKAHVEYLQSLVNTASTLQAYNDINSLIVSEINKFYTRYRDRSLINSLITFADTLFLTHHKTNRNLPLNELNYWSKEDLCSGVSYLIFFIRDKFPPEQQRPFSEEYILKGEIGKIVVAACLLASLKEIEIEIQDFNYKCVADNGKMKIYPPVEDFEKSIRLGYIRTEIQSYNDISALHSSFNGKALSLEVVVEKIYESSGDEIFVYTESHNFPRYVIKFIEPLYDLLVEKLLKDTRLFQEEYYYLSYVFKELLLNESDLDKIKVRHNLSLLEIIQMRRILYFFFLLFRTKIYEKHKKINDVVIRSLVPTYTKKSLFRFFEKFTTFEKFESFLDILTWKVESKTIFDIQYHPLVEMNGWIHAPLSIFAASSFVRNVFASEYKRNNEALLSDGSRLVNTLIYALNSKQISTYPNTVLKDCEIDVAAIWDDTIFIFECKQALHPTSIYDLRTTYDYILKAEIQLERILKSYQDKSLQKTFERNHSISMEGIKNIIPAIILSNRMFTGDTFKYPVRNIYEATNMIETGIFRAEYGTFTLWEEDTLTSPFLIKYFSKGSSLVNYYFNSLTTRTVEYPFLDPPLTRDTYYYNHEETMEQMKKFTKNLREVKDL